MVFSCIPSKLFSEPTKKFKKVKKQNWALSSTFSELFSKLEKLPGKEILQFFTAYVDIVLLRDTWSKWPLRSLKFQIFWDGYKIWKKTLITLNRLNELAVIEILNRLYCSNVDLGSHEPVTYLGSKVKPISTPTSHTQTSTQTSQDNIRHVCLARDWINFKCHDTSGMSHRGHGTFNLNFECSNLLLDMHSSIV